MFAFLGDIFQYKWHFMTGYYEANGEQTKKKKALGFTYIFAYLVIIDAPLKKQKLIKYYFAEFLHLVVTLKQSELRTTILVQIKVCLVQYCRSLLETCL